MRSQDLYKGGGQLSHGFFMRRGGVDARCYILNPLSLPLLIKIRVIGEGNRHLLAAILQKSIT